MKCVIPVIENDDRYGKGYRAREMVIDARSRGKRIVERPSNNWAQGIVEIGKEKGKKVQEMRELERKRNKW